MRKLIYLAWLIYHGLKPFIDFAGDLVSSLTTPGPKWKKMKRHKHPRPPLRVRLRLAVREEQKKKGKAPYWVQFGIYDRNKRKYVSYFGEHSFYCFAHDHVEAESKGLKFLVDRLLEQGTLPPPLNEGQRMRAWTKRCSLEDVEQFEASLRAQQVVGELTKDNEPSIAGLAQPVNS